MRLEPLTEAHVAALVAAASVDRASYALTIVPGDEAGMRAYVAGAIDERRAGRAVPFATVERRTGRVVGSTRFANLEYWSWPPGSPHQRPPDVPDAVEIGYTWLSADVQRTGINTEAKLLMLGHAFEVWRVLRVTIKTDARNTRTRAAIERLGAQLDGVLRAARPGADGALRDTASYSIVEPEWPAVKAALAARLR